MTSMLLPLVLAHFCRSGALQVAPEQRRLSLHSGSRVNATTVSQSNVITIANATEADAQLFNASIMSSAAFKAWQSKMQKMSFSAEHGIQSALKEPSAEEQQCDIQQQYTAAPTLCSKDNNHIPRDRLMQYMQQFKKVWSDFKTQFGHGQTCCMGLNHQFAMYTTVKEVNPLVIIESGVAAGRGTWLLRNAAGPNIPIFSLDPGVPAHMYGATSWTDTNPATKYLVGGYFQDLSLVRWDILIPDPTWRARTLIILDDHQSSVERLKMLRRWGFRYAFYEDNYPFSVATSSDKYTCEKMKGMTRAFSKPLYGDAYSPNTICAPVPSPWNFVLEKDRFGHKCKFLTLPEHAQNVQWYADHVQNYFEFPAVFSRCKALQRTPLLGGDIASLTEWGFPQPEEELWQYGHLYPALIELQPLPPQEVVPQYQEALSSVAALYKEIMSGQWP
jgi:hypothetical protein